VRQVPRCPDPDDMNGPDGDYDCDDADVHEPVTLALLALGLRGIGLGRIRKRPRT
jgi:hypothetical protein